MAGGTDAERLFVESVRDIDRKVVAADSYSDIRAAGLLRQLTLDSTPLVHQVNRGHRVPLRFRTMNVNRELPSPPRILWLSLDPEPFPNAPTIDCSLTELLQAPCLRVNGKKVSVRDLIKACANVKGGVHLGAPRSDQERAVLEVDATLQISGTDLSVVAVAGICRVVLSGLRPLVEAVVGKVSDEV